MSLSMKQKWTYRHKEQTCCWQEGGGLEGQNCEVGLADINYDIQDR